MSHIRIQYCAVILLNGVKRAYTLCHRGLRKMHRMCSFLILTVYTFMEIEIYKNIIHTIHSIRIKDSKQFQLNRMCNSMKGYERVLNFGFEFN